MSVTASTIQPASLAARLAPFRPKFGMRRAVVPLGIIALWQASAFAGLLNPQTMPSPAMVAGSFWQLIVTGQLWPNLVISLERVVFGLAAGVAVGTALGLVAGLSRLGEDAVDPTVQMARTLPHLALIPLMILWFGIGETPKLVLIGLGSSFPIYLNLFSAIRGADRKLLEAASMLGLSQAETIWHVILPAALPGFLVGLRQALGIAWITLVVAEQINASAGIGYLVMNARDFLRTDIIFDGLLVYALLGLGTDQLVRFIEKRALAWRPSTLRPQGATA
jgi:sulfonate transport system permease protein